MDRLRATNDALYAVLAVLACTVAVRHREHRPLAAYVTWMAVTEWARWALELVREGAARPYTGVARLTFHVDQLFFLSAHFLFAAACLHYFHKLKPHAVILAWMATFLVCCVAYPTLSRAPLVAMYKAITMIGIAVAWAAILSSVLRRKDVEPTLAHLILILYAATDVTLLIVPFTRRSYLADWPLVQLANIILLVACSIAHAHGLSARARGLEVAR